MTAQVQILVNGEPQDRPFNLAPGDSVLYTLPGHLVNGRVAIAEQRVANLEDRLAAWGLRVSKLEQAIRDIAKAATLDEAIGIAYRSGSLNADHGD